jgi:hypothetical protein
LLTCIQIVAHTQSQVSIGKRAHLVEVVGPILDVEPGASRAALRAQNASVPLNAGADLDPLYNERASKISFTHEDYTSKVLTALVESEGYHHNLN